MIIPQPGLNKRARIALFPNLLFVSVISGNFSLIRP
jgi:hypothetical protein